MDLVPMPIVMGMVAGVFLRFGTDLVRALGSDVAVAAPMVVVFLLLSARASLGRGAPPIIGALVGGRGGRRAVGTVRPGPAAVQWLPPLCCNPAVVARRRWSSWSCRSRSPSSSCRTGRASPYSAPPVTMPPVERDHHRVRRLVAVGGGGHGGGRTCLTGRPTRCFRRRASARATTRQASWCGLLAIVFGLLAPVHPAHVGDAAQPSSRSLAGLAMLASCRRHSSPPSATLLLGALVAFLVTVADITLAQHRRCFLGFALRFCYLLAAWSGPTLRRSKIHSPSDALRRVTAFLRSRSRRDRACSPRPLSPGPVQCRRPSRP